MDLRQISILLILATPVVEPQAGEVGEIYVSGAISARPSSFDIAAGYMLTRDLGAELRYIDEGKQPYGILNINRVLNLDLVVSVPVTQAIELNVRTGFSCSRFSHNGSNEYQNNSGYTGWNTGVSLVVPIGERWSVEGQYSRLYYQQSDRPEFEPFDYGSLGLRRTF